MDAVNGVYLPVVTPFRDGRVDLESYRTLVEHSLSQGIHGLVPFGTTGELPTLEQDECDALLEASLSVVQGRVPVYIGLSSNSTDKAVRLVRHYEKSAFVGFLVTSPHYSLPSQEGIVEHYKALAGATDKKLLLYNIPHRTGRNLTNATIQTLSSVPNIVGIKDTCGHIGQTIELLREKPPGFSVMTGDDQLFFLNLVSGGNGGILASAHFQTRRFVQAWDLIRKNDLAGALKLWNQLSGFIPLLFQEPSPGAIKYVLQKKGLIATAQLRLPMTGVSPELSRLLDQRMADGTL